MPEDAWSFAVVLVGLFLPVVLVLLVISFFVRHSSRKRYISEDVWASVMLAYVEQADGILPIGVVRVQNPHITPVIVSVSLHSPRWLFGHRHRHIWYWHRWYWHRWCRRPLSVRSPKVSRRPRPPEGTVLGAVTGGGVRLWELPLATSANRPDRLPVVRVRLDPVGPCSKVFAWALHKAPVVQAKTSEAGVPRRLVLTE
jgi:hypothetical protein